MKRILGVLLVTGMLAAPTVSWGYDDGDSQIWLKGGVSGKLGNGLKLKFEQEMKYGDDCSEFFDEETAFAAEYKCTDWLKIALGYKVVQERKNKKVVTPKTADDGTVSYSDIGDGDHYWQNEERPFGDLVFFTKVAGWKLEDRTRFEWRMKDDGKDDYLRFRNRLKVKFPWKMTALAVNPYVAWEAFYEDKDSLSSSDKWDRHRYYVGVSAKLSDHFKGGLYYLLQTDRSGDDWKDTNVVGFEISAIF